MNIHVTPATPAEEPILRNLGELYAHDFSAITHTELGPLGRYDHDFFSRCDGERRTAYLVRVDGALAGFAIVAWWEVRERMGNEAARDFWRAAIGSFTSGRFEEEEVEDSRWRGWVQRFEA